MAVFLKHTNFFKKTHHLFVQVVFLKQKQKPYTG